MPRRRAVLRRRHHQPLSPCLLGVYSSSSPCLLGVLSSSSTRRRPASSASTRRPASSASPCLLGVYSSSSPCLPASSRRAVCAQPPCCLRPAVVVCSAQQSRPAVVALPPCIQPPCCLRPAAVLPAPSRQARRRAVTDPSGGCAQPSGTPSRPAVTRAVTLPAPSRQARRRAPLPLCCLHPA